MSDTPTPGAPPTPPPRGIEIGTILALLLSPVVAIVCTAVAPLNAHNGNWVAALVTGAIGMGVGGLFAYSVVGSFRAREPWWQRLVLVALTLAWLVLGVAPAIGELAMQERFADDTLALRTNLLVASERVRVRGRVRLAAGGRCEVTRVAFTASRTAPAVVVYEGDGLPAARPPVAIDGHRCNAEFRVTTPETTEPDVANLVVTYERLVPAAGGGTTVEGATKVVPFPLEVRARRRPGG
jgi:hypothetical protein